MKLTILKNSKVLHMKFSCQKVDLAIFCKCHLGNLATIIRLCDYVRVFDKIKWINGFLTYCTVHYVDSFVFDSGILAWILSNHHRGGTPPKTNMYPENQWVEDVYLLVSFQECIGGEYRSPRRATLGATESRKISFQPVNRCGGPKNGELNSQSFWK